MHENIAAYLVYRVFDGSSFMVKYKFESTIFDRSLKRQIAIEDLNFVQSFS